MYCDMHPHPILLKYGNETLHVKTFAFGKTMPIFLDEQYK